MPDFWCTWCGDLYVEGTTWYQLSTGRLTNDDPPNDDYWCPSCQNDNGVSYSGGTEGPWNDEGYDVYRGEKWEAALA